MYHDRQVNIISRGFTKNAKNEKTDFVVNDFISFTRDEEYHTNGGKILGREEHYLNALLDEMKIYNNCLTDNEIAEISIEELTLPTATPDPTPTMVPTSTPEGTPAAVSPEIISFYDRDLAQAVREVIGKETGPIYIPARQWFSPQNKKRKWFLYNIYSI